ncbi:hypothetical protein F7725_028219 [Dissostichus mawsoni]|uniref:Reverse transcriptase n=1 Tax=Dissostichus mawsoni TaxID=36200 RepID=A0A7J5XFD4_DISMA|nr:hypothetical protein F7725_028219 [Dissostichus mawsoni]
MNKLNELRNPWICLSLKVWNRLVTQNHLREAVKGLRWCVYDLEFLPGRWDARFKFWSSKGLTAYCTFLHKGSMNSFQNLKGQFDLKRDDFYRFLQVRHHIDQIQRESTQVHWDNTLFKVHGVLQKVFQVGIPFKFESLYLGALPPEMFSSRDRYLFRILSAACKKAITRMWLKPGKPTLDEWIDIVYDIFKMERIVLALRLQQGIFLSRWEKWLIYATPIRPSFV